jgi:hypothetical protein
MNHPPKCRPLFSAAFLVFLIFTCAAAHAQNTRPEVTWCAEQLTDLNLNLLFDLENKGRLCSPPAKTVVLPRPSVGVNPSTFFYKGGFYVAFDKNNSTKYGSYHFEKVHSNGYQLTIALFQRAGSGERAFGGISSDGKVFVQDDKGEPVVIGQSALMQVTTPEGEKRTAQVSRFIKPDTPWSVALGNGIFQANDDGTLAQKGWVGWRKITTPEGKWLVILMTKGMDRSAKWAGRYDGVLYMDGIAQPDDNASAARRKTTKKYDDGSTYDGDMIGNKRDGRGTYTSADGNTYVGEWKDDKNEGQGKYRWANGDTFAGAFRDGKMYAGEMRDKSGKVIARYKNGIKE